MIKKLWNKWKNHQDEKLLAQNKARDAELGTPTKETLNDRAKQAAGKGYWKTALAAVEAGADVNTPVRWKQFYGTRGGGIDFEENFSLSFLAIKQDNAQALQTLLDKGADKGFTGTSRVNERTSTYSLAEFAALNGASKSLDVILEKGKPTQAALDGALKITASTDSYLSMTEALLNKGAQGFEAALRAAELGNNKKTILMLRKEQQKAGVPAPEAPSGFDVDVTVKPAFGGAVAPATVEATLKAPAPANTPKSAPVV